MTPLLKTILILSSFLIPSAYAGEPGTEPSGKVDPWDPLIEALGPKSNPKIRKLRIYEDQETRYFTYGAGNALSDLESMAIVSKERLIKWEFDRFAKCDTILRDKDLPLEIIPFIKKSKILHKVYSKQTIALMLTSMERLAQVSKKYCVPGVDSEGEKGHQFKVELFEQYVEEIAELQKTFKNLNEMVATEYEQAYERLIEKKTMESPKTSNAKEPKTVPSKNQAKERSNHRSNDAQEVK